MVKFEYYDIMIYQIYLFYKVFLKNLGEDQPMNLGYFIFVPFYNLMAFNRDYLYMIKNKWISSLNTLLPSHWKPP